MTDLSLSPGFFDPRLAMSDDDDEENVIPQMINVENENVENENDENENDENENDENENDENENDENDIFEFVNFWFVVKETCACDGREWSRTSTY
ncbi:hypothetical protein PBCVNEJV1_562L [Paramecium bursaria Chlorella virus NE-JV-1]|nr:hypothetical protein PBCVNEJV1_562L [Paramecium bursaria Chlorella virus NE-JV-1]